ncbi:MAG: hypothetical protein PHE01_08135 [Methanosarcina sp.]|nr:hypothetical protein [Methanosarcina sp.]
MKSSRHKKFAFSRDRLVASSVASAINLGTETSWVVDYMGSVSILINLFIYLPIPKSNCERPPHLKRWGMLRAARSVFRYSEIVEPQLPRFP